MLHPDRITAGAVQLDTLRPAGTPDDVWNALCSALQEGAKKLADTHRLASHAVHALLLFNIYAYLRRVLKGRALDGCSTQEILRLVYEEPPEKGKDRIADLDAKGLPDWIRAVQRAVTVCTSKGAQAKHNLTAEELDVIRPLRLELGIECTWGGGPSLPNFLLTLLGSTTRAADQVRCSGSCGAHWYILNRSLPSMTLPVQRPWRSSTSASTWTPSTRSGPTISAR